MNEKSSATARAGWLKRWWMVILWLAVICILSGSYFSFANTAAAVRWLMGLFLPAGSSTAAVTFHLFFRKGMHFVIYAILFLLLAKGPLRGRPSLALLGCVLIGVLDEAHQMLLPNRTPSLWDVALDTTGALFARFMDIAVRGTPSESGIVEDGRNPVHAAEEGAEIGELGGNP